MLPAVVDQRTISKDNPAGVICKNELITCCTVILYFRQRWWIGINPSNDFTFFGFFRLVGCDNSDRRDNRFGWMVFSGAIVAIVMRL